MEHEIESEFLEHGACAACGSSDANAVYTDHTYCFSCTAHVNREAFEASEAVKVQQLTVSRDSGLTQFITGDYQALTKRGISKEICRAFDYSVGVYQGKPCHIAPVYNDKQQLVAQTIRLPEKDFRILGDLKAGGLIFQHKFPPGGKRLVITEGALDALSYATVAPGWEVVSVPNGASGAVKAIKRSLEFVDSFDEVVLLMDQDAPGIECALEVAALLSPGKCKIASMPLKDANAMLLAGLAKELKICVYDAKLFSPEGIVLGSELLLDDIKLAVPRGLTTPFLKLDKKIRGLRKGELTLICAGSGIGKSTLTRELGYHLAVAHGQRVGYLMLEESVNKTAKALIAIDNSVPYADLLENTALITDKAWQDSYQRVVVPSAFYDHFGATEVDNIVSKVRFLAVGIECDYIVLDHLSMVVAGSDKERIALDELMVKLRSIVENTGVGVIAVSHISRGKDGKSYNEGAQISLNALRGSASLEQLSDIVIGLERDQQSEHDSDVAQIRVLKSRLVGDVGVAGHIKYDVTTGRMNHYEPEDPSNTPHTNTTNQSPGAVWDQITDL